MGPMEIVRVISFVLGTLNASIGKLKNYLKLERDLKNELEALTEDLGYLMQGLEEEGWKSYDELLVTELVYDIEDFVLGLRAPGAFDYLLSGIGMDPREKYLDRIKSFKEKMGKLEKRRNCISMPEQGGDPASSSVAVEYAPEELLVGITEPKKVILDLLKKPASSECAGGQEAKKPPKVISIVGCPGVGKTALARAVYDHYIAPASRDFECVAWVEAAGCNDETALLAKIHQKVEADLANRASVIANVGNILQEVQAGLASRSTLTAMLRKILQKVQANFASRANLTALLGKILRKIVDLAISVTQTLAPLEGDDNTVSPDLHGILADKRYLVFIDDVQQTNMLKDIIDDGFPKNAKSGMVIITTAVNQVANVCSPGSYVYTMKCLGKIESKKLFCRKAFEMAPEDVDSAKLDGLESIINKCGGLPLALISMAKDFSINPKKINIDFFDKVVKEPLAGSKPQKEFRKLKQTLVHCYEGLPDNEHKTYMRSLSIFPRNHPIKCKSLVRRLVAEGLVVSDGREYLDELVDRCIVEPVHISSYSSSVKSFQVDVGIMLEFIIHKSLVTNFVTLIREEEVVRNTNGRIRRLSVQSSTRSMFEEVEQESKMSQTIRSLTIFPSQLRSEVSEIVKCCRFLRLLDLEGCRGLDEDFFNGICKLVYLKYLSLRRTDVKRISQQIKKLRSLQTLDIRDTQEMELPIQVITLPKLAYLFGLFLLPKLSNDTKEFLERESKLHTVVGFVVGQGKGSEDIMLKAKNLKKVEVFFRDTSSNDFVLSLRSCFTSLESLSIDSNELSQGAMAPLDAFLPFARPCKIRCMKLSGKLARLPSIDTLGMINNLNKLQLSYTGLTSDALSMLQYITRLQYLKLHENEEGPCWDGIFTVFEDGFESLLQLCFDGPKLPKLQFNTGSMKSLTSLQLFCRDMSQMQVAEEISDSIKHITSLNAVILHSFATESIVNAWKSAANINPSRPSVSTTGTFL